MMSEDDSFAFDDEGLDDDDDEDESEIPSCQRTWMKITRRVVVSAAERIQQLPAPFLSELQGLHQTLDRRGKEIVDLGKYAVDVPISPTVSASAPSPATIAKTFADYLAHEYQVDVDPEQEILLVPGIRVALLLTAAQFVDAGTICHLPDPGFDGYRKLVLLFEGKPRTCPIYQRNDYLPNLEQFDTKGSKSPRLLFLTSPHNPTGAICDENFYSRLQRLATEANILVDRRLFVRPCRIPAIFGHRYSVNRVKRLKVGLEMFSFSTNLAAPHLKLTAIVGRKRMIDPWQRWRGHSACLPSVPMLDLCRPLFCVRESLANHIVRCREEISIAYECHRRFAAEAPVSNSIRLLAQDLSGSSCGGVDCRLALRVDCCAIVEFS